MAGAVTPLLLTVRPRLSKKTNTHVLASFPFLMDLQSVSLSSCPISHRFSILLLNPQPEEYKKSFTSREHFQAFCQVIDQCQMSVQRVQFRYSEIRRANLHFHKTRWLFQDPRQCHPEYGSVLNLSRETAMVFQQYITSLHSKQFKWKGLSSKAF